MATRADHPAESSESDEQLVKLLLDVEEVATTGVDPNDNDDILEVRDDDQSSWMLDQIATMVIEEELKLIRKTYRVAEEITLHRPGFEERPSQGRPGEITLFTAAFECGLRLPMASVKQKLFVTAHIHPFQLTAKSWQHLVSLYAHWQIISHCDPSIYKLRRAFALRSTGQGHFYTYKPCHNIIIFEGNTTGGCPISSLLVALRKVLLT